MFFFLLFFINRLVNVSKNPKKMEKWAESMNKKKKPQQQTTQPPASAELNKKKDPPTQTINLPTTTATTTTTTSFKKVIEQNKNEVIRRLIEFKKISKNMLLYLVFYKI